MSRAPALVLRSGDRERLAELARLPSVPSGLAKRARIVLLAADGLPNTQIARAAGVSRPTVIGWRDRYRRGGIPALRDEPRSGRPAEISEADVVIATIADHGRPPARLGVTYWSARFLAAELGISFASVARIWRRWGIKPRRAQAFTFGTHPHLESRVRDVIGLYLGPEGNAVAVSLGRGTARNGTADLLAALDAAAGQVTGPACGPGHRHQGLPGFLAELATAHPGTGLHVIVEDHGTHREPEIQSLLARPENQHITLHVAAGDCGWLSLVEVLLAIITHPAGRDGAIPCVKELTAAIRRRAGARPACRMPFTWMAAPDLSS